jgi:hypothetical protein
MLDILTEPKWFFGTDLRVLPEWFSGYDGIAQLIFSVVTLIVSMYAFKVFRLTQKKESRDLGLGFLFISISYSVWALLNLGVMARLSGFLCSILNLCISNVLHELWIYIYMILFIIGILVLLHISLKNASYKVSILLALFFFLVMFFSTKTLFFFYLLTSVVLIFLLVHYFQHFQRKNQTRPLMMALAFLFLVIGNILFVFGLSSGTAYMIGLLFEFTSYMTILFSLPISLRK